MSLVIYFSGTCYLLLLQCTSSAHTSPLLSLFCFYARVFQTATIREAKKKREKSLQRRTRIGPTRFSLIKGAVSADGDGKHSTGVDDLALNEPPSQMLALTSRCHMWLHVPYGV